MEINENLYELDLYSILKDICIYHNDEFEKNNIENGIFQKNEYFINDNSNSKVKNSSTDILKEYELYYSFYNKNTYNNTENTDNKLEEILNSKDYQYLKSRKNLFDHMKYIKDFNKDLEFNLNLFDRKISKEKKIDEGLMLTENTKTNNNCENYLLLFISSIMSDNEFLYYLNFMKKYQNHNIIIINNSCISLVINQNQILKNLNSKIFTLKGIGLLPLEINTILSTKGLKWDLNNFKCSLGCEMISTSNQIDINENETTPDISNNNDISSKIPLSLDEKNYELIIYLHQGLCLFTAALNFE